MNENTEAVVQASEAESAGDVWASLRQARESLGMSVSDVSAHLKLTSRQIEAIERGELSVLPGAAFARGFVRNYARYLGLDPIVFTQAMDNNALAVSDVLTTQMNPAGLGTMPFSGGTRNFASLFMALGVLALLLLLSLGAYFRWFESRDEDLLAEIQTEASGVVQEAPLTASAPMMGALVVASEPLAAMTNLPAKQSEAAPSAAVSAVVSAAVTAQSEPAAAASAVASSGGQGLKLAFEGEAWVEVRDATGKALLAKLNPAGSHQLLQGAPPLSLIVGNAPKVTLVWRGKEVDLKPHTKVDVARLSLQ